MTFNDPSFARPGRLYLDNAATSFPKPASVLREMSRYATQVGASAGRGAYAEAVEAGQLVHECRVRLNRLFHGEGPDQFIFTLNCTDALNIAIKGLVDPRGSGHAICSCGDHNSILRPLSELQKMGAVEVSRVPVDGGSGLLDPADIRRALRADTRLIALTHVSNVTGTVQPLREVARIAREAGVPLVVDAAQSAGHLPIDLKEEGIDLLAAPGHKALLGPLGTGFLYIRPGLERRMRTFREGGTGSSSEEPAQPDFMPDRLEAGSHNAIGLAGLAAAVAEVMDFGIEQAVVHDGNLVRTFLDGIDGVDGLRIIGINGVRNRIGVFSIRIDGIEPHELSAVLEERHGILTRSGLHCAPLMHEALGTLARGGTTRLSFGRFVSLHDVQYAADALADVAIRLRDVAASR